MTTSADSVLGKISRWASECPDSTALTDGTRAFSYGELDAQSDQFAAYLRELGVANGDAVGLCTKRSLEWLVAALGTMKAGAAYVPIDPSWPDSRVQFALSDSGAIVFVGPRVRFDRFNLRIRHVDPFDEAGAIAARQRACATAIQPESVAYIVYTSGSTGVPKGVEITHANLNHLVAWHCKAFSLTSHDRTSHLAGLGFDAAVWEIWPSLCAGATLCLAADSVRLSAEMIQRWMLKEQITIGFVPTVYAAPMMAMKWPAETALRVLLTGGDALQSGPQAPLPFKVVNNYGPAECTVVATSYVLKPDEKGAPPIGRAIAGAAVYVLDEDRKPVADAVTGEIYIGGNGVGPGYRNLPDATHQAFLPDPFVSAPGARMYRTGDRAIRQPDGTLEFRGRMDRQIKIRGQRVELDEIGNTLARHPSVAFAAATTRISPEGSTQLVAYFLPAYKLTVPQEYDLRAHLRDTLPDYMVPSIFVQLETLPVSANGKVDLSLLPSPSSTGQPIVPTQSVTDQVEIKLMRIVHDLLGGRSISEHDNLFLSGGHSLFGMQLLTRVRTTFGVDLSLQQLFDVPTVHGIASVIQGDHETPQKENLNRTRDVCGAAAPCCSSTATAAPVAHDADNAPPDLATPSPHTEYVRGPSFRSVDSVPLSADATGKVLKGDIDHTSGAFALNREGTRTPIFWVHNPVISLAKELGGDQPFFIFTLTAFDIAELGQEPSLHDLAARFLSKILADQPDGNFILGGLCIGSVLVYEIAQQMRTLGLEPRLLILLDAPTQPYLKSCASLRAKFGHPSHSLKRAMRVGLGQTVVNLHKRLLKSIPFSLRSRIFPPDWEMLHEMIENAAFVYYPQPYDGEVFLLLSANAPRHLDFLPGWQLVAGSKLTVAYVDVHHREFITPQNVRAIAETVNQYLPDSAKTSSVFVKS
ncbi:MAG: amino acid adenylation domain-containing protein [Silvibacterium sp.]